MLKFLITLSSTALGILALTLWGMENPPDYLFQTLVFLFVATAGLYRFLLKTKLERPDYFVQLYLLTLVIKIIASGVYLFVMVVGQPEPARDVVFFMAVYFVFTAIEIGFLYSRVNQ